MIPYNKDIVIASYFHCSKDGNTIGLLPLDHARAFPLSFDLVSRKVVHGDLNFYNQPFYNNFRDDKFIDPSKCNAISSGKNSSELIIYNVLDNCFGHAFLKLLLALQENARSEQDGLLIVPKSLAHFVKKGVFKHAIEINMDYKEFESCYILNKLLEPFVNLGYKMNLFPVHTYGNFKRELLFAGLDVPKPLADIDKRRICFYYRKDEARMWDGNNQSSNIVSLFEEIKRFFGSEIRFTVIGSKDNSSFPAWIDDKRVTSFSAQNDVLEHKILSESLIVISITGSHMLMPSLLSAFTVHLHPLYKYKNMAEDLVNTEEEHGTLRSYRHVFYYGNKNCSDIAPADLAYLVLLHFQGLTEKSYKLKTDTAMGQKEWIAAHYPYLKYAELNQYRSSVNNKKDPIKRILSKIKTILGT